MATKKISQLETISDSNLSGEAILPVVVSDPLIPNRKAKVNQLMKGVSQGTKAEPGLCFDLDRDTGLYQNAYNQIGVAFGDGGLYATRLDNGNDSTSLYITAVDDVVNNTDIVFAPKGTGSVKITGQFLIEDSSFVLEDSQGPKVRFEVGNVGTGTSTRLMTLPQISVGNGTTLVGDNTTQTLTNKTLLIDEDNFVIVDGTEEAIFQINWPTTSGTRRSYFLPDAGAVTTGNEPTATSSTILDTKAEQTVLNKTLVTPKMAANADDTTNWVQWNTSSLSANRTLSVPDQSLTLVGTESTQTLTNKTVGGLIVADTTDPTKRFLFDISNSNSLTIESVQFPPTGVLNNDGDVSTIVTELATQDLKNKTIYGASLKQVGSNGQVNISVDNITATRVIRFPDADATLLSTENVTVDDVNFGAGIGAANLTSRTRLQQFFYAGF